VTRVAQERAAISQASSRWGSGALAVAVLLGVIAIQTAQAEKFKVLYNFTGAGDGGNPYAGLVRGASNLYGTTSNGGKSFEGAVFQVTISGKETVLYSFTGGADGGQPYSDLVLDAAGNLYGTTANGGTSGNGTVFEVSPSGQETVLYSFAGYPTDGAAPSGGLIQDAAGNLYGTTNRGGSSGMGTVFKVDTTGTETVLHTFAGGATDGAHPYFTRLKMDQAGNVYGVTEQGGASGQGVVFEISSSGTFSLLHSFAGGATDGSYPSGPLIRDSLGNLRGTTTYGGTANLGTVFELSASGTLTVLHSFAGGTTDGSLPCGGLLQDLAGNLYGTAAGGGAFGVGTIYKLTKSGTFTVLHSFKALSDGAYPYGTVLDAKGHIFSTALEGGSGSYGTVFELIQ